MQTQTLPHEYQTALPSSNRHGAEATIPTIQSAQDYLRQARLAFNQNDLGSARKNLRAALAFQPEDTELLLALGHIEFGMQQFSMALERYTVVCEMDESSVEAHSSRALTLKLLNRSREARESAEHTLSLAPRDLVALKVMARIHLDCGSHDRAREFCRRILDTNPLDPEALQFLDQCQFNLAAFLEEKPVPTKSEALPGVVSYQPVQVDDPVNSVIIPFPR